MKTALFFLGLWLTLTQCGERTHPGEKASVPASVPENDTANKREGILNNIVVVEKGGLEITRAYLADESGRLLNPENIVATGHPVYLTLLVAGWREEQGSVSPGATQTITTHNGEPVVASPDLFAGTKHIPANDAAKIRLKAVIQSTRADIAGYVIRFRIWDKRGKGEVSGYYHLRLTK